MDNSNPGWVPCDQTPERKRFVVVSGIPGSGKSTLARALAPALGLPLLDKDTILEHLFDQKGIGDPTWRRMLSRLSDSILQTEGAASNGAVLVSHWRLPGMRPQSGTPTAWLKNLNGWLVNVRCTCSPEFAAERFVQRIRHPGHRDDKVSYAKALARIQANADLGQLNIGQPVNVDTTRPLDLEQLIYTVQACFQILRVQSCSSANPLQ